MGYTNEEFEKELRYRKNNIHIKYISGISFACVCGVVILMCCDGTTFQNCVSVSSTVVSIILSVIAIILSVTGERSTNEIRNKIVDVVERLSSTTEKTEKTNSAFNEISKNQIGEFDSISKKLEELVQQLDDIKNNTSNTKEILDQMVAMNEETQSVQKNIENVVEYICCLRKKYNKGYPKYMLDRTIEYIVMNDNEEGIKIDDNFFNWIIEHINKIKCDVSEKNILQGTYITVAVCLSLFNYSDDDKQKILNQIEETKSMF